MKLTTAIKAAQTGLVKLEKLVAAMDQDMHERGKELTRLRSERDAQREMLNAMWKLQDAQKPGETVEFNYSESGVAQRDLIQKLCSLYTSEVREIGDQFKISKEFSGLELVRRIVEDALKHERFDETCQTADAYIAKHRTLG